MGRTRGATEWKISDMKEVCETLSQVAGKKGHISVDHPQVQMLAIKLGREPKNVRRLYRRVQRGTHPALNKKSGRAHLGQFVRGAKQDPTLIDRMQAFLEGLQQEKQITIERHEEIIKTMQAQSKAMIVAAYQLGRNRAMLEASQWTDKQVKPFSSDITSDLLERTIKLVDAS